MNISLQGKSALICGSSQGIGLAVAQTMATLGANCTLLARNKDSLETALKTLTTAEGQHHHFLVADFSDPEKVKEAVHHYLQNNQVHILVNNTGGPPAGPVETEDPEAFEKAFRQHLVVNHLLAKAVLPSMKQSGYGRIINIISTSVRIPFKNLGVSNTIRAAVASWSKSLSNEVGRYGITVNSVLPGYTKTGRLSSLIDTMSKNQKKDQKEVSAEMEKDIPMQRFGEPAEIAAMVAFLASPAASYVHGISVPVDGGRTGTI